MTVRNYAVLFLGAKAPEAATAAGGNVLVLPGSGTGEEPTADAHIADATDAHDASAISYAPTGTIAATDVQAAVAEVASEAASALSSHAAAGDPHPGYTTAAEVAAYAATVAHTHTHASTTGQTANDHHNRQHSITSGADHTFPGGTTDFLRADGTFAAPPGGVDTSFEPVASSGAAQTIDITTARTWWVVLDDDCALTPDGFVDGEAGFLTLALQQDVVGGRLATWDAAFVFPGGTPVLATDPGDVDFFLLVSVDGGATVYVFPSGGTGGSTVVNLTDLSDVTITTPAEGQTVIYRSGQWVNEAPSGGTSSAGLIPVDVGTSSVATGSGAPVVTVATDWGIDGTTGDPYYDATGAAAGEEAALYWSPADSTYVLVPYSFP